MIWNKAPLPNPPGSRGPPKKAPGGVGRTTGFTLGLRSTKTGGAGESNTSHRGPSGFQARFDAGELITQRELVSRQVSEDLTERAATFGLILDDVSLVRVLLSLEGFSLECAEEKQRRDSVEPKKGGLDLWTCGWCLSVWNVAVIAPVSTSGGVAGL